MYVSNGPKKARGRSATDLILDMKTCSSEKDDAESQMHAAVLDARSNMRAKHFRIATHTNVLRSFALAPL